MMFFFFNDTATTEIYTLSLHDALPICPRPLRPRARERNLARRRARRVRHGRRRLLVADRHACPPRTASPGDRKSTRLNSSHDQISYAVFCLKKKKNYNTTSSCLSYSYV